VTAFGSQSVYSESMPISAYEGGDRSSNTHPLAAMELGRAQQEIVRLQGEL
jgi:hypothetical protein